jgi:hypothetical protein
MANGFLTMPVGYRVVELYDVTGRMIWSHRRGVSDAAERVKLPTTLGQGVWQARLTE